MASGTVTVYPGSPFERVRVTLNGDGSATIRTELGPPEGVTIHAEWRDRVAFALLGVQDEQELLDRLTGGGEG